jgi:voltage-gated potassium channel
MIPVIIIEESEFGSPWDTIAAVANWVIWAVFLGEVVVLVAVVPNPWRWLKDHPLDVAIVVLTPPFLPSSLQALRVFRLLRLLRLLRVIQAARRLFSVEGLRYAGLIALLTILGGGAAFAAVERGHNETVGGTWDGVWWAVVTMTTVGYGDVYPRTTAGRLIAIVVMVLGIGFLGLLIGAAAERFVARDVEELEVEIEEEVAETAEVRRELRRMGERLMEIESALAKREYGNPPRPN